jgi:hypothetical protein
MNGESSKLDVLDLCFVTEAAASGRRRNRYALRAIAGVHDRRERGGSRELLRQPLRLTHRHQEVKMAEPKTAQDTSSNPKHHVERLKLMLNLVATHAREDSSQISEPDAQALLETPVEQGVDPGSFCFCGANP